MTLVPPSNVRHSMWPPWAIAKSWIFSPVKEQFTHSLTIRMLCGSIEGPQSPPRTVMFEAAALSEPASIPIRVTWSDPRSVSTVPCH